MPTATGLITYEDSLSMPENRLEEVVDGIAQLMSDPTVGHALLLRALTQWLDRILPTDYAAVSTGVNLGIRRSSQFTYRIPDLLLVPIDDLHYRDEDLYVWSTPELIVECLSPANRKGDRTKLLSNYESIATPEVWFIYPESQSVEIYRLREGKLVMEQNVTSGEIQPELASQGIPLEDLWNAFRPRKR